MTPQDFAVVKSVLVSSKMIDPSASDADVMAMHTATLAGPSAGEYRTALAAQGVQAGPNWLTMVGIAGGLVAVYFIWKHYQKDQLIDSQEYPEPHDTRLHLRGIRSALGTLAPSSRGGSRLGCAGPRRLGRLGTANPPKYEFEPEVRLEGYRRKARRT